MELLDIFELRTTTTFLGQNCINLFYYIVTELTGTVTLPAGRLCDLWNAAFWGNNESVFQSGVFSDDLSYAILNARNLYHPEEIGERLLAENSGSNNSQNLPPFVCYSLRTSRTSGIIRRGFKRFPGVCEDITQDGIIASGVVDSLNALGEELTATLTYTSGGNSVEFTPVTVKRVREGTAPNYTYRLPTNSEEGVWTIITEYEAALRTTSQVTRKTGRGT